MGDLDTHLTHASLGLHKSITQIASRVDQPFLHSSQQTVPILYNGPLPPKLPLPMGDQDLYLTHCSLGPPESITHMASQLVQPFLQGSWQSIPILYNGTPFSQKLPLPMRGTRPPSNTLFLWPTRVLNPNGISICSIIFCRVH